jgi:hypothetical protein
VLLGVLVAALAACSRPPEAVKPPAAGETRAYLKNVGQIRALVNGENRDQLPVMIRTQDQARLAAEAARIGEDLRSLAALPSDRVDPGALRFTRNFRAILEAYRSACLDTSELFRKLKAEQERQTDPALRPPDIRFDPASDPRDTIGTLDTLLDCLKRPSPSARDRWAFLAPSIEKVRRDRDTLRLAKEAHHDFTLQLRPELGRRYPGADWTSKDILP